MVHNLPAFFPRSSSFLLSLFNDGLKDRIRSGAIRQVAGSRSRRFTNCFHLKCKWSSTESCSRFFDKLRVLLYKSPLSLCLSRSFSFSLSLHPTQKLDTMGPCSSVHVSQPFVCLSLCLFYRFADKVNTSPEKRQACACCSGVICCVCTDLTGGGKNVTSQKKQRRQGCISCK